MENIGRFAAMAVLAMALMATSVQAMTFEVSKDLEGLKFIERTHLPKAPALVKGKSQCGNTLIDPQTEAGKLVAAQGWGVTGEGALGDYTAVSFAGSLIWGPLGLCNGLGGRVGIFQGKSLVALLTQDTASGDESGSLVGTLRHVVNVNPADQFRFVGQQIREVGHGRCYWRCRVLRRISRLWRINRTRPLSFRP